MFCLDNASESASFFKKGKGRGVQRTSMLCKWLSRETNDTFQIRATMHNPTFGVIYVFPRQLQKLNECPHNFPEVYIYD